MLALELIGDTNYFASNQLVTHAATVHVIPLDLDDAQMRQDTTVTPKEHPGFLNGYT